MEQRHLFPMPRVVRFKLTSAQQGALDWVAINEGRVGAWPRSWAKQTLRRLIGKGLVKVVGQSPGRYMLTGVGRLARQPRNHRIGESSMFFTDAVRYSTED